MATLAPTATAAHLQRGQSATRPWRASALLTLARRRLSLSARTPREIIVPLVNPVFFALIIAPALAKIVGSRAGFDYLTYAAIGTVGLLIPLNTLFAGIGVIIDRQTGAQRDLLAAPVPRGFLVLGNLAVAMLTTSLQVCALLLAAGLRGAKFNVSDGGILWFVAAAGLLAVGMYGVAEILASRMEKQEDYVGALPAVAILPYFFAGSLFPISTLPSALTAFARFIPLTHALALARYALIDPHGTGLHEIWGAGDLTSMAARSAAVLAVFAVAMTALSIRLFARSASR